MKQPIRPMACPMASAGAAAASPAIIGIRRRRSAHNPVATPPRNPPNQLSPPRLKSSDSKGASSRNSTAQTTFAPTNPPSTPMTAASTPSAGSLLRLSSEPKIHMPVNAPSATSAPNVVTSKPPMRKRIGYTLFAHCTTSVPLSMPFPSARAIKNAARLPISRRVASSRFIRCPLIEVLF